MRMVPPCFCAEAGAGKRNVEKITSDATKPGLESIGHLPRCMRSIDLGRRSQRSLVLCRHGKSMCGDKQLGKVASRPKFLAEVGLPPRPRLSRLASLGCGRKQWAVPTLDPHRGAPLTINLEEVRRNGPARASGRRGRLGAPHDV